MCNQIINIANCFFCFFFYEFEYVTYQESDVVFDVFTKHRQNRVEDVLSLLVKPILCRFHDESNCFQFLSSFPEIEIELENGVYPQEKERYLDAVFSFKQLLHFYRDLVVLLNTLGVPKSWRVDNSQRKWDAETVSVIDIVDGDFTRLAVCLRPSPKNLVDELESKGVFKFHTEDIVDQGVDHRRLARSGGSHQKNRLASFACDIGIAEGKPLHDGPSGRC